MILAPVRTVSTLPGLWPWFEWAPAKSVLEGQGVCFNKVLAGLLIVGDLQLQRSLGWIIGANQQACVGWTCSFNKVTASLLWRGRPLPLEPRPCIVPWLGGILLARLELVFLGRGSPMLTLKQV